MAEPNEPLSERELEILRLVATGAANKEIAQQLVISPNTVKVHLRNIFAKIGVASRTEATLYAVKIGLVTPRVSHPNDEASAVEDTSAAKEAEVLTGLPSITIEDQSGRAVTGQPELTRRARPKSWQVALVVIIALVLIGSGVIGTRIFMQSTPTPRPTVAAQSITQPPADFARWVKKNGLPAPRKSMAVTEYENALYLIAGATPQGSDGMLLRYDPLQDTWKELAHKPTAVSEVQAAVLGELIYVPGGRLADGTTTDRLEVYNPREDRWESKATLPVSLSGYALAAFEGDLYLFGGKTGSQVLASVYHYDSRADRWDQRAPMSTPRAYASAVPGNGKIQLIGGYDGSHALTLNQVYYPSRDSDGSSSAATAWEDLAPLPQGRYAMGAAHLASLVYLLGGLGEGGAPAVPAGLQYISQSDQWLAMEPPPQPVGAYPALLASGNYLFIFGGETSGGLSSESLSYQAIYTISVPVLSNDKAK